MPTRAPTRAPMCRERMPATSREHRHFSNRARFFDEKLLVKRLLSRQSVFYRCRSIQGHIQGQVLNNLIALGWIHGELDRRLDGVFCHIVVNVVVAACCGWVASSLT